MKLTDATLLLRYQRQMACPSLGLAGQRALLAGRVLVVGVGGLGSWTAELLARAGVGFLRLVDDDAVDFTNIHRQGLYDEADALSRKPKVQAAAERIREINAAAAVESVPHRLGKHNIASLADGVDVIVDGTDNFASRYVINDYAVKTGLPWIFAGVVGAEAQTMTIIPGRSACLRCVLNDPPPPCTDPSCRVAGVIGPAVAVIAAIQAAEVMKLLADRHGASGGKLTRLDLWAGVIRQTATHPPRSDGLCPCCGQKDFEYLEN